MAGINAVFGRPFKQQVAAFRLRLGNLAPTTRWDDIWKAEHDRAFMVAGALKADLLADLAAAVDKAISQGTTLETFRKDFREIVARNGWEGYTGSDTARGRAWRTRVIYKTNLSVSYASGRWAQLMEAKYPFLVYRHGASLEPREQHLAWDGLILPPDHPFWASHAPPNGWGCSCYVLGARSREAARRLGGKPELELPDNWQALDPRTGAPVGIDRGWDYAPGASVAEEVAALANAKVAALPDQLAQALAIALAERRSAAEERAMQDLVEEVVGEARARLAMAHARRIDEPRLTVSERAAIATYSGNPYENINRAVRGVANGTVAKTDPFYRLAVVMDAALAKLPKYEGMAFRGMPTLPTGFQDRFEQLVSGDVIAFRAFTSASTHPEGAFSGPVLLRIRSRSGRVISHLSFSPHEREVLFGRGLQFRFLERTFEGLRMVIDLEEIAPGEWLKKPKELMSEGLG